MRIPHIDDLLEAMTFSTESLNNYISAIGSHISHLSAGLSSSQQYLANLSSLKFLDVEDSLYLLLAGRQRYHKFYKTYSALTFLGAAAVMILIVCVVIKNKLDSRKISNKDQREKNKARDEKCLAQLGQRSQAGSPKEKKNSTLLGTLSSYCHLGSPDTQSSGGRKGGESGGKLKTWFSLGTAGNSDQQFSVDLERKSTNQVNLMRKMCGEFRDFAKLKNKDEREERQKELEKIRGAR